MKATVQAGFSLFEILLAIALLSICLLLISRANLQSLKIVSSSYLLNRALVNAEGYVELSRLQWLPADYWHSEIVLLLPNLQYETEVMSRGKRLYLAWRSAEQFKHCQSNQDEKACLTLVY